MSLALGGVSSERNEAFIIILYNLWQKLSIDKNFAPPENPSEISHSLRRRMARGAAPSIIVILIYEIEADGNWNNTPSTYLSTFALIKNEKIK